MPALGPPGRVRWVNFAHVMWETHKSRCAERVFGKVLTFYGRAYFMNDHNALSLRVIFHSELRRFAALIFSWMLQSPERSPGRESRRHDCHTVNRAVEVTSQEHLTFSK